MRYKIEKHSDHIHVKEDTSSETAIKNIWLVNCSAFYFFLFHDSLAFSQTVSILEKEKSQRN